MVVGCEETQNESWFPCDQEQKGGFEGPRSFELLEARPPRHGEREQGPRAKQSKAAVRLKEDMKQIVTVPLNEQRNSTYTKLFGVSLQDLHQQGLTENGVPAIVGSIVEYLTMHGLTQEGLFRVNGNVRVVEQLRWKFESGVPVKLGRDGDVCAAASLLKLFLRELPEGVITSALQPRFIQLFQDDRNDAQESSLRALIKELPDTHYCLLKYLCQFLTKVAKHHVQNRMNVHNLATVFGPNCFHTREKSQAKKVSLDTELCCLGRRAIQLKSRSSSYPFQYA
ncbi:PREDICTED: protein FAM13A-like [Lipotes vexillifer]|uniref:Protein FAM13A-like n=1 Tax=Lipotes vexillifer TaxID=118797 RepID=A0A340Y134_LIPVE|nr:PREDICTED: protein FAM13A-like [Lipotes vexillifer]